MSKPKFVILGAARSRVLTPKVQNHSHGHKTGEHPHLRQRLVRQKYCGAYQQVSGVRCTNAAVLW